MHSLPNGRGSGKNKELFPGVGGHLVAFHGDCQPHQLIAPNGHKRLPRGFAIAIVAMQHSQYEKKPPRHEE